MEKGLKKLVSDNDIINLSFELGNLHHSLKILLKNLLVFI